MQHASLGQTALKVSRLALGTMNFGPRTSASEAFSIMSQAADLGFNLFDTANQYGGTLGVGVTETIVGDWLVQNRDKRERLVIATKVHEPMSDDINDRGLSARHIQMACEASLRRLRIDCIDLYQMHHIDRLARPEEVWQAMDRLITQGKITYVGSSNFPGWKIAQMNERAKARGRLGLVSEQGLYNLLERRAELEVLPACREYGLGLLVWSPLAGGLLAGPPDGAAGRRQTEGVRGEAVARAGQLGRFFAFCQERSQSPGVVALAWLLHQPAVASAIVGPRTSAQLAEAAKAAELALSADDLAALDAVFPPCGPAPEAYAW